MIGIDYMGTMDCPECGGSGILYHRIAEDDYVPGKCDRCCGYGWIEVDLDEDE